MITPKKYLLFLLLSSYFLLQAGELSLNQKANFTAVLLVLNPEKLKEFQHYNQQHSKHSITQEAAVDCLLQTQHSPTFFNENNKSAFNPQRETALLMASLAEHQAQLLEKININILKMKTDINGIDIPASVKGLFKNECEYNRVLIEGAIKRCALLNSILFQDSRNVSHLSYSLSYLYSVLYHYSCHQDSAALNAVFESSRIYEWFKQDRPL